MKIQAHKENTVVTEAETRVMQLLAKEHQGLIATTRSWEGAGTACTQSQRAQLC